MKRLVTIWISAALLFSCMARLPKLTPDDANPLAWQRSCQAVYPVGDFQVTHRIDAAVAGAGPMTLLGITVFSTSRQTLRATLMTLEGFVLFSAEDDGDIRVLRAVPPFDKKAFAHGMLEDLRLLFFLPKARVYETGWNPEKNRTCRYHLDEGARADVTLLPDGGWNLGRYDPGGRLERTLEFREPLQRMVGFSRKTRLTRHGRPGYILNLTLVEAKSRSDAAISFDNTLKSKEQPFS